MKVNPLSKLWGDFELADYLGVSPGWVADRGRKGIIPCIQMGKYRRYDTTAEDFRVWLDSLKVKRDNAAQSDKDGPNQEDQSMARTSYQKGTIEQRERRQGAVWVLRYRLRNGNGWIERTEELQIPGSSSQKDARAAADKRMIEVNVMNNGSKTSMTFSQFAAGLWEDYMKRVKESTAHTYACTLKNHLLPKLADKMLNQISPADITDLLKESAKTLTTGKSLKNVYGLLQVMFEIALEYDLISSSPVRRKLHRPPGTTKEKVALSAEQIRTVIECAEAEHRAVLICIALTGLRIGELRALRWMDIDFNNTRINVTHTLWNNRLFAPKTLSSKRSIHIPDVLMNVLRIHLEQSRRGEPDDFVFSLKDGSPLSYTYLRKRILCPALDAAGIKREKSLHGFHLFRHSAATILDGETKSLRAARDLLGHSQESTTAIYTHTPRLSVEGSEILAKKIVGTCGLVVAETSEAIQ